MIETVDRFSLDFANFLQFQMALEHVAARHGAKSMTWEYRTMTISFYSAENRAEMKEQFDILGWKCNIPQ